MRFLCDRVGGLAESADGLRLGERDRDREAGEAEWPCLPNGDAASIVAGRGEAAADCADVDDLESERKLVPELELE